MILRLHEDQNADNTNIDGWAKANSLTADQIAEIVDPNGGDAKIDLASIPSPFGRWDLIRTAFRNVAESGIFVGNTLDHRLVSDTLDVAQVFFHLDRLKQQGLVEVLCWDKREEIELLKESSISGHRELGKTLEKYMAQDAASFNFDKLDTIALVRFIDPNTGAKTVLGSTSSVTLFNPAPGDLLHVSTHIRMGLDKLFDGDYCPLNEREEAFVLWLYALRDSYPLFAQDFKAVNSYLEKVEPTLKQSLQKEINQLTDNDYTANYVLQDYDTGGNPIKIVDGLKLYASGGSSSQQIAQVSDFAIKASRKDIDLNFLPLVLPSKPGYEDLHYVVDRWDKGIEVPVLDPLPLEQRRLPASGELYPYLSIGDFLEDTLIQLENAIESDKFYPGELGRNLINDQTKRGYLLPLKPCFFNYFTVEDLISNKMLVLEAIGTDIRVTLSIPVKAGKIVYERFYSKSDNNLEGVNPFIYRSYSFELGLLRTRSHSHICYVADTKNVSLKFYDQDRREINPKYRLDQELSSEVCTTLEVRGYVESMRVVMEDDKLAYIIPLQKLVAPQQGVSVSYAVDLGTTNTTVAFRNGTAIPELISWSSKDLLCMLTSFNNYLDGQATIESRLLPPELGQQDSSYSFPLRTVLRINKDKQSYLGAFSNSSPDFTYQRTAQIIQASDLETDVKWKGTFDSSLTSYVACLCKLIAMHAESRGASSISISWSYPSSMNSSGIRKMKSVWNDAVAEYIESLGVSVEIREENEAVAPYLYYARTEGIQGRTVAMDIGGETVDILLTGFTAADKMHLSSFRLGGNTLLESPSNAQTSGAGLCMSLKNYLEDAKTNIQGDALNYVNEGISRMEASLNAGQGKEGAEYFFALERIIKPPYNKSINLNLADILGDEDLEQAHFRSLILIYFLAQVYHVAKLTSAGDIAVPDNFVFSGNGSRLLRSLGDKNFLSKLITEVFVWVYDKSGRRSDGPIEIKAQHSDKPKVATAYGMLYRSERDQVSPIPLLLIHSDKLLCGDAASNVDTANDLVDEQVKTLADINELVSLFKHLIERLRLVKDQGYTEASLDLIAKELANTKVNGQVFASIVVPHIRDNQEIAESLLFTLLRERIKQIGIELYNNLCK